MAEKDMTEKALEAYDDVFADIVNSLMFDGREKVQENGDSKVISALSRIISYRCSGQEPTQALPNKWYISEKYCSFYPYLQMTNVFLMLRKKQRKEKSC
ncbi:MAG: hypothetical protein IJ733_11780 [Lachnospiraceae bacterium]|nr:hypothetical protein [Lachnospiraceae bacterium]